MHGHFLSNLGGALSGRPAMYLVNSSLRLFRPDRPRPWRWLFPAPHFDRLALGVAAWVLVGVLDGVESYYKRVGTAYQMTWGQAVAAGLLLWAGWMLMGLAV